MKGNEDNEFNIDYISTSGVYKTPFSAIILLQLFIGGIILVAINLWFINSLYYLFTGSQIYPMEPKGYWFYWLLLPLNVYGNISLFVLIIVLFSGGINKILNKICPPREGRFPKGSKDWKYFHRRFWLAYFPIWLARALPLPWIDVFVYKLFGTRVGKSVVIYDGYVDPLFIEIGDNSMTSLNTCIFSHLIYHDHVIIKKINIGRACIVGPQTVVSPGTIMKDGAILGANSYTSIGQTLEGNLIHVGLPVSNQFPIQSLEKSKEKLKSMKEQEKKEEE